MLWLKALGTSVWTGLRGPELDQNLVAFGHCVWGQSQQNDISGCASFLFFFLGFPLSFFFFWSPDFCLVFCFLVTTDDGSCLKIFSFLATGFIVESPLRPEIIKEVNGLGLLLCMERGQGHTGHHFLQSPHLINGTLY